MYGCIMYAICVRMQCDRMPLPSFFYIIIVDDGGDGGRGDRDGRDNVAYEWARKRKENTHRWKFIIIYFSWFVYFSAHSECVHVWIRGHSTKWVGVRSLKWTHFCGRRLHCIEVEVKFNPTENCFFFLSSVWLWINALPICAAIPLSEHITHCGRIKVITCYIANTRNGEWDEERNFRPSVTSQRTSLLFAVIGLRWCCHAIRHTITNVLLD